MISGTWLMAMGKRAEHFILTPRDENLAWRHTACGQIVFLDSKRRPVSRCKECERRASVTVGDANG